MSVCQDDCREEMESDEALNTDGSSNWSNCLCCGDKLGGEMSIANLSKSLNCPDIPNRKLKKSNILDKLHLKLNKLKKLNAQVKQCNDGLEDSKISMKSEMKSFKSKQEFDEFLDRMYNEKRYSYCVIKCKQANTKQRKTTQSANHRIPRNMGWNWKLTHSENWQPGCLPKIIKMRMSHFLNYYPCDTLPISRLNIKLSKTSFNDEDNREAKIKKMIHSMGFSPCFCNKSVAWCMCREKGETTKLKHILEQIEQQIGESGLEYKLYLNQLFRDSGKKMPSLEKRLQPVPDLISQETQYETADFKYLSPSKESRDRLSKPKYINSKAAVAKSNNSSAVAPKTTVSNVSVKNPNARKAK